ncbi:hypothetical protein ACHAXS_013364 [Conticribra weissflogii]
MHSSIRFLASMFLLSSNGTMGLTSSKFAFESRTVGLPKRTSSPMKLISHRKSKVQDPRVNYWRDSSRLTSTYIEARTLRKSMWGTRLSSLLRSGQKWFQKRSSKRLVISFVLGIILLFSPAFSPARASTAVSDAGVATSITSGPLQVQNVPFPLRSRALGSFNFLPTKAELELSFRLLYSACTGAFIGLERSSADRPAGVRTMALVGLGACIYTICSCHGFVPPTALGYAPGSPVLQYVKCDIGRMAANVASGVGFIGAGAIHKSKQHGNGTEAQNVVAGLTTAAAIWVSAAVGVASAVGLYFVGAIASLATVGILKFAKVPKEEEEPGFSWAPKPLDVVDDIVNEHSTDSNALRGVDMTGLFGKYSQSQDFNLSNQDYFSKYPIDRPPIIIKEIVDPRFERYLRKQFESNTNDAVEKQGSPKVSSVLIEEEQQVVTNTSKNDDQDDVPLVP